MAISSFSNPIPSIIDGLMRGSEFAMRLRAAQRDDQEFKTQQTLQNQQMSMQDIMNQKLMEDMGARRVGPGDTIQDTAKIPSMLMGQATPAPAAGTTPDLYNLPQKAGPPIIPEQSIDYLRKADKSRVSTLQDRFGAKTPYELPTREERIQRAQQAKTAEIEAEAAARTRAQISQMGPLADAQTRVQFQQQQQQHENELKLEGGGRPAPPEFAAIGITPGRPLLQKEWNAALQEYQGLTKPTIVPRDSDVYQPELPGMPAPGAGPAQPTAPPAAVEQPGQTTLSFPFLTGQPGAASATPAPAPGATPALPGMRLLKSGGVPEPTGEFGTYLRAELMKSGYTMKNAPPDLVTKAVVNYANKTKDPAAVEQARQMHALTMEMTQARLDQLKSQQGTGTVDYKPGTREYKVAQDLAYGRLTMQQFRSLTGYSRDVNKKMDIYQKATELNPNFNPAQFEMGFKFAANPKTQQQLASMDNVAKGADDLLKFSDAASRSGVTALNKFINPGGIALGGKRYSDFHTAQVAFADELSGALGFGGATDMSKQMGIDMTNPNLSPENFKSAVQNVVLPFIERKRKSLLDQMGTYGQPGMNPAAGAGDDRGVVAPIRETAGPRQQPVPPNVKAALANSGPGIHTLSDGSKWIKQADGTIVGQ
jgi:hypothetical protein